MPLRCFALPDHHDVIRAGAVTPIASRSVLVERAAGGDPAALGALFDAFGAEVYAFCHRMVGSGDLAADATQDAFLAAVERGGEVAPFRETVLREARTTSLELLGSRGDEARPTGALSAANMRLRPQQRAALAITGLTDLSHIRAARVLDVDPGGVAPLVARAWLRLRDEMRGTGLAAAAVRTPDCEEALPLLAGEGDGALAPEDEAWLAEHVATCATCPRTRAAMAEAAATYAAWSPAAPPSWLRASTLAEFESDRAVMGAGAGAVAAPAAATAAGRERSAPARAGRGPGLAAAALGCALVIAAFALLVAVATGPLREGAPPRGSVAAPAGSRTVAVAQAPATAEAVTASTESARSDARGARAAGARARAAAARARARVRAGAPARPRVRVRVRAASSGAAAGSRPRVRTSPARRTVAPRRTAVTPARRTAPVAPRPTRRTPARRPRRSTTTPAPVPAAPAPATGGADEQPPAPTASTSSYAPAAPAAARPTQSTAAAPAPVASAGAPRGRACGQGGCGAPPRCAPVGNCGHAKGRQGGD